ncbi:MAG: DUF3794 domain-containing protein [Clostridia bacterium]|nr:DUF3794 domain-containing protein [Clostridia bacterium]
MSLELVRETIKVNRVISKDSTQTIVENDIIVPDTKPDISRILLFDGEVVVNNTQITRDKALIDGSLNYKILYLSDDEEQRIKSINSSTNFSQSIDIGEADPGFRCIAKCDIEHIDYGIVNSRKVNVKTIVKADYKIASEGEQDIVNDLRGIDDVQTLKSGTSLNCYVGSGEGTYTVSESMEVPAGKPPVKELLRSDIKVTGKDYKITDNKVVAKGELNVSMLYIGDDETRSIQFMEHEIPFTQLIDLNGVSEDSVCRVDFKVMDSKLEAGEDSDGELRTVHGDIVLGVMVEGYEKRNVELVEDAYSTGMAINLEKEVFVMEEAVAENRSQVVLKDTVAINEESPEIAEVFNVLCKPSLSEYRVLEDKLVLEGSVFNNVLYLTNREEEPVYCHQQEIPFKQNIDIKGIKPEMACEVALDIDHCNYSMVSSSEVEVRLVIGVDLRFVNQVKVPLIVKAVEQPLDEYRIASQPSLVIYFAQPGDNLWKVAKRYYTTIEDIKRVNNLAEKEHLAVGQQLIIPRKSKA